MCMVLYRQHFYRYFLSAYYSGYLEQDFMKSPTIYGCTTNLTIPRWTPVSPQLWFLPVPSRLLQQPSLSQRRTASPFLTLRPSLWCHPQWLAQAKSLESPSVTLSPSPLESNQSQAWWHPRQHRSGLLLYCPNWLPCFCPLCPIFISKTTVRMILWKSKSGDVTLLNTHKCSHRTNT